jgi:ribosomal subunit interface protein
MAIRVSGKNISIGEALQDRVRGRIADVVTKYFDGDYSGHVTIGKDGFGFRTDCVLHLASGIVLEADALAADAYDSADNALGALEKRLRRYKSRLRDRHPRKAGNGNGFAVPSYVIEPPAEVDEEVSGYSPVTVWLQPRHRRRIDHQSAAAVGVGGGPGTGYDGRSGFVLPA